MIAVNTIDEYKAPMKPNNFQTYVKRNSQMGNFPLAHNSEEIRKNSIKTFIHFHEKNHHHLECHHITEEFQFTRRLM